MVKSCVRSWRVGLSGICLLLGLLTSAAAFGQGSCVQLGGGCTPPEFPSQCFPDVLGPISWTDPGGARTTQVRFLANSPNTTCHAPVGIGAPPRCCTSFHPPANPGPSVKLRIVGRRVWVDYDAPNYYCQNTGDWPPFFTCTNDPLASSDNLFLFRNGDLLETAFIYYENGSWDTGIDVGCGGSQSFTARIGYVASPAQLIEAFDTKVLKAKCPDRRSCPFPGVGKPVNVGSGDVSLAVPLFTLAQAPLSLSFSLSYHSGEPLNPGLVAAPVGLGWTHPFAQTLRPTDATGRVLFHLTGEGFESEYTQSGAGTWVASSPGELRGQVTLAGGQYALTDLDLTVTRFDAATGKWLSTTDRWGNALTGSYDGAGNLSAIADSEGRSVALTYSGARLAGITLPDGQVWSFGYDGAGNLAAIFDPLHTGATPWRSFAYTADSQGVIRLLSEMRDESGALIEGHAYDAADRGTTSVSAGGRDSVTVEYDTPSPGQSRATHAIDGATSQLSIFSLTYGKGRYLPNRIQGNCATCGVATGDDQSFTFSSDNHMLSKSDGNGHVTRYTYNADGNVLSMTEAAGTAVERTTTYRYGYAPWPNFRTEVDEPSAAKPGAQRVTTFIWNATGTPETTLTVAESGFLLSTDAAPTTYTSTTTFDARHRPTAADGPRTDVADVVTMTYYSDTDPVADRRGRMARRTDATGLVTTLDDYDAFGTARRATDPNGAVTIQETDGRGRITRSTAKAVAGDPAEAADYVATYSYDGRDRLLRTLLPLGNGMAYGYEDGTNRLTDTIRLDLGGNQVERRHLTLNVIGGKVQEEDQSCAAPAPVCPAWTTKRSESFTYDLHDRLSAVVHPVPAGSRVSYAYDPDGLLATVQDEDHTSPNTSNGYDALHRLTAVQQTLAGAPGGTASTSYAYDVMDNLAAVTDPNGNVTRYQYDDFRRLARQDSPVTGTTTYRYDPAGNLIGTTDARGAVTTRAYDPASRLLSSTAQLAGSAGETVSYSYDAAAAGNYGKGRLAQMTDPSGSTTYTYERRGLLKGEVQTVQGAPYTTGFRYDANGNRTLFTYPSGRQVTYTFDFADRPLSAASGATPYVSSAGYLPFGPETRTAYGNGTTRTFSYDPRYRPLENRLDGSAGPLADYLYGEDSVGNVTSLHDALDHGFDRDFAYDDLYRLTGTATGNSLWGHGSYRYDPMGNMTSQRLGNARALDFSYQGTLPQLAAVTVPGGGSRAVAYDPAGNELTVGGTTSTYSARNLLAAADGLAYTYDGRGVRTALSVAAALGTINGTVVDAGTGAAIAGATVRLTGTANGAVTDAAGHYVLTAAAGIYTLTASQAGYLPATGLPLNLPAGADVAADPFRLSPAPGRITGTVVSSLDGAPLAGVAATVPETGLATFTDAAGSFTLQEPAGTYSLSLALPGYVTQTLPSFPLAAGGTHAAGTLTLLANPATVTGRVLSSVTSAPLAGATVTATPRATGLAAPPSTTTAAAGNFNLSLAPGTYSLTIAAAGFASRTTAAINLGPGAAYAFGNLTLDPLGTITGTVVKSTDGTPVTGATVTVTGTLNQATTNAVGAFTLTQPPGTYTLSVQAAGFADLVTPPFTLAPGGAYAAGTLRLAPVALSVFVGYADNLRASSAFPVPWEGSPNVVFLGTGPVFDAGAIRLDNATDAPIAVDGVTVDLGRPGPVYNLWGSFTVPAHGAVVLTQTVPFNFDSSDFGIVGCGQTLAPGDPRVPRVTVTVGGAGTTYFDTGHILDTGGYDLACRANESLQWRLIGTTGINSNGDFLLALVTGTSPLGTAYTLTSTLTDANNQPLPNVTVTFKATSGPNSGKTGQAVTDAAGRATFTYVSTFAGTDSWQATVANASGGSLVSNPATVVWPSLAGIEVFVGYADNLRSNSSFPTPWQGSPNVVFLGGGPSFDAGAVRLDNTGNTPLVVDKVVVDLERPGPVFDLWGSFTIPAHGSAIVTQTFSYNFDTSDFDLVGCGGKLSPTDPRIPKITVTIAGLSASYLDTAHILDTFGYDLACRDNESLQWRPVGVEGTTASGQLALRPDVATNPVGALYTATAAATDAVGEPLGNVTVGFSVLSGPNAGKTGQALTNAAGLASFTYTGAAAGTDIVKATITNQAGGVIPSNQVTAVWIPTVHLSLAPATATQAVGTSYNATLLATDGSGHPVANLNVIFQIGSGPNTGRTGHGTTDANGQAVFTYTSTVAGSDLLAASVTLQGGAALTSNQVTAVWTSPLTLTLAPLSATAPLGSPLTFIATLADASHNPAPGATLSFRVLNGPNAGATGQATTGAAGQATFTYTSSVLGADTLVATAAQGGGTLTSNLATATWIAIPTTVVYLGPAGGETNDPSTLRARLTESATGRPLAGQSLTFTFGGQTLAGTTDASGVAAVAVTPTVAPGTIPLTVAFAGAGPYTGSSAALLFGLRRDETAIVYTGKPVTANGIAQTVSARLTDVEEGTALAGKTITFTLGAVTASAVTDANGVATATLTLPATQATGLAVIQVAFAGDTYEQPAQTTAPVVIYQPSSFVVWGGNTPGLAVGQRVNFWGSQWEQQVLAGDDGARGSFKGYATVPTSAIGICEPTARTTGSPLLDQACWTSKPGNSSPPATLADFIQVIVSTSINQSGSTVYGNIAATVVVKVDRTSPYAPDPGHPGFGTIVAVIDDGAGLFPRRAAATGGKSAASPLQNATLAAVAAGTRQLFLYTPEMNLVAETELTTNARPLIANEYIWWNGHPVAQVDATGTTSWTFTDHLGTPILQTSAQQGVVWRAEYEPFGTVYALRSYDKHQPLRLPGQEAEQLGLGANGVTDRSYNIHRWYRGEWGRYTQADPLGVGEGGINIYRYASGNPLANTDLDGLRTLGIGGTVLNFTDCCVIVSDNDDGGKGQKQRYIPPYSTSGSHDVDAIYFKDGSALKIPDGSIYFIYDCSSLDRTPTGFFSNPLLSYLPTWLNRRYRTKSLPDRPAQEKEFGGPILPPTPDCHCK